MAETAKVIRPRLDKADIERILLGLAELAEQARDADELHTITELMARITTAARAFPGDVQR